MAFFPGCILLLKLLRNILPQCKQFCYIRCFLITCDCCSRFRMLSLFSRMQQTTNRAFPPFPLPSHLTFPSQLPVLIFSLPTFPFNFRPAHRPQFEGLRSNVTYAARLMALVGPHHWPYTLLNFTVTSPTLHTGKPTLALHILTRDVLVHCFFLQ